VTAKFVKLRLVKGVVRNFKVRTNAVLAGARNKLRECVVLGYTHDGELYAASSEGPGDTVWLMEHAKKWLLDGCPQDEDGA